MAAICSSESINSAPAHSTQVSIQPITQLVLIKTEQHTICTFNFLRGVFVDDFRQPAAQDLRRKLILTLINIFNTTLKGQ